MSEFKEPATVPDFLADYLDNLHTILLPYTPNGEIFFGEVNSPTAVRNNSGWARARFQGNQLVDLLYVKPPEVDGDIVYISSLAYTPSQAAGMQLVRTIQHIENGILYEDTAYVDDIEASTEEIIMFLLQSVDSRSYTHTPREVTDYGKDYRKARANRQPHRTGRAILKCLDVIGRGMAMWTPTYKPHQRP